ncbi:MarR family winged helix-turn-helix transcriptional regulator [Pyrobaculum ferrireducens]|uniref:Regulatory protein, MarR n=1 Tax=Pyrobaculum ferrireducens TaxID=1104324 RepID=G7VHJ6_9CREN|nr:MarR family transcriptional regulator [Pyrobaculum ferrireducens]AET33287.1 regulatory protein, MarR [Pyrobaculum ferrireducens]
MISDALDRLARVYRYLLLKKATSMGLTELQLSILLHVAEGFNTVGRLAERVAVSQPTVSDAVLALERKGLVRRIKSGRLTLIELTPDGLKAVGEVRRLLAEIDEAGVAAGGPGLRLALLRLIAEMQKRGLIEARLCLTCRFFKEGYCMLLEKKLEITEYRVDCPDYKPATILQA